MLRVVVCVSGGGTNFQAILDAIDNKIIENAEIVGVISNNANAYALKRADKYNIENVCISPKSYNDRTEFNAALLAKLKEYKADLIVLAGFMVNIPAEIINEFRNRIINVHPSLIPSFCGKGHYGLHVHEAVLEKGVKVTGATVHYVDEGIDTGKIIAQKAVEVLEGDTPKVLQERVMKEAEWIILPKAIAEIAREY